MDVESFKKQFLPFHIKLYRIAFALLENSQDAEDIVQDLYYKLWEKKTELVSIRNPEAFCVTLVKNMCLDFLRSPKSKNNEGITEYIFLQSETSPESEFEEKDKVQQLIKLIDRLPENQRQILRLRGLNDCSLDEIEQITGLSAVNIRVLLSRGRKLLREQYQKLNRI